MKYKRFSLLIGPNCCCTLWYINSHLLWDRTSFQMVRQMHCRHIYYMYLDGGPPKYSQSFINKRICVYYDIQRQTLTYVSRNKGFLLYKLPTQYSTIWKLFLINRNIVFDEGMHNIYLILAFEYSGITDDGRNQLFLIACTISSTHKIPQFE